MLIYFPAEIKRQVHLAKYQTRKQVKPSSVKKLKEKSHITPYNRSVKTFIHTFTESF